jgi:subtilase family serine protease
MTPTDMMTAYSLPASAHAYGKIVAVVDMPDANVFHDVNTYRAAYNIPALPQCASGFPDGKTPCFAQVDETGMTPNYTADDCPDADGETALDVEMVSSACPDCSILVVQMSVAFQNGGPTDGDFIQSAQTAAMLGAVATSISFGGEERLGEPTGYTTPGHLVFAASGDSGYLDGYSPQNGSGTPEYPASAPDVLGVGGTTLVSLGGGSYAEKVWNEPAPPQYMSVAGGSGCSTVFEPPAFQTAFLATNPGAFGACQNRDSVDLASAAEFVGGSGGISTYDTASGGWNASIGTSAASPTVAAIFVRIGIAEATSNDMGFPYTNIAAFNKVAVAGTNAAGAETCTSDPVQCNADGGAGWNGPTGVGTPNAAKLAPLGTPNMPSAEADAGPEGGSAVDSGSAADSGSVADSGSAADSGGSEDAGGTSPSSSKSGCSCESVGAAQSGLGGLGLLGSLAMGAGAIVVARRRRSRS